jgi:hypothetical protein
MNKYRMSILAVCFGCLLTACNTATPERYFDLAVLNTNMITGISNDGLMREMEYPSVKLVEGTKDQTTPMKRKEVMDTKIHFLTENLDKLKQLKETTDTKEMLQTAVELNEYVLSIYKTDYVLLAKLYDDGASKDLILAKAQAIQDKYGARYEELLNKLISIGKSYASANHIKVNWGK